jgi:hypothetical protein
MPVQERTTCAKHPPKDGKGTETRAIQSLPKEIPMKNLLTKIGWIVAGLVLACFCSATTHAQATIAPDNYPRLNTVPITPEAVKVDFQGNFSQPNEVQCHGHKLAPGKYTLVVKTVGTAKMVTLQREGSDVVLHSRPVTPTSVSDQGHSAVLVRHGPDQARTHSKPYMWRFSNWCSSSMRAAIRNPWTRCSPASFACRFPELSD